jgi:hypothetical protein
MLHGTATPTMNKLGIRSTLMYNDNGDEDNGIAGGINPRLHFIVVKKYF